MWRTRGRLRAQHPATADGLVGFGVEIAGDHYTSESLRAGHAEYWHWAGNPLALYFIFRHRVDLATRNEFVAEGMTTLANTSSSGEGISLS